MEAIQEIAQAVEEESEAIAQVTEGIDQISSVVQTNSATSEESAAASEELSSQAALMKELMSKFHLRSDSISSGSFSSSTSAPAMDYSSAADEPMDTGYSGDSNPFSKYYEKPTALPWAGRCQEADSAFWQRFEVLRRRSEEHTSELQSQR